MDIIEAVLHDGSDVSVVLVNIVQNGSDRGVFVNGKLVLSADPSCGEDVKVVSKLSSNLVVALGASFKKMDVSAAEDWTWDDVALWVHNAQG
jgi:hypothetical protein